VYLTAIAVIGSVGTIQLFWPGIAGSILMIRDYWPAKTLLPGVWLTGHFWSLSVEEHFYMLLPGFLVLCRRWRLAILASMAVVFEVWRFFVLRSPTLSKWGFFAELRTDTVLGGILLGSVFAIALSHPRYLQAAQRWLKPWITLLLAAFITHLPAIRYSPLNHPASILLYPLMIFATVLHPEAIFSRFLSLPVLRFVGRISYSLYLWQQLFLNPFATAPHGSFRSHNLLCWTAAVACAIASYYLIETPCIRFGHALAKRINRLPVLERMGRNRLGDHREVILYSTTSPPDSFLGL
jgi:peptidoglycan/LPS O-acetylase OafA/YrhL